MLAEWSIGEPPFGPVERLVDVKLETFLAGALEEAVAILVQCFEVEFHKATGVVAMGFPVFEEWYDSRILKIFLLGETRKWNITKFLSRQKIMA